MRHYSPVTIDTVSLRVQLIDSADIKESSSVEKALISNLFNALFGCRHKHYSFPITMRASSPRTCATTPTGTYVVCLDCWKKLQYDWDEMKVVSQPDHRNRTRALVAKEAD